MAVDNFPTHFLLNVREHHGIASVVSPWCSVGPLHQGTPRRNTKEHQGFSVLQCSMTVSPLAQREGGHPVCAVRVIFLAKKRVRKGYLLAVM